MAANRWVAYAGFTLHLLIGLLVIFAGGFKLFATFPPEVIEDLKKYHLEGRMTLIGLGEAIAAILMIVPKTSPLGTLLMCGFWGGVILMHMVQGESILLGSLLLLFTMCAAEMRGCVRLFASAPENSPER